jgi:hypothetical protein
VSQAASIQVAPPAATVTLNTGQSQCVTATVTNLVGTPVPDGAAITFTYQAFDQSGNPQTAGMGQYTLTQPSTGKTGGAASGCTAPPADAGQAVANLTVVQGYLGTITVTATMCTAQPCTASVSGSTTINDPPDPPSGLVVTPGSIRVRFQPSRRGNVAGYVVLIGTAPGQYTRKVDIGKETQAHIEEGIEPGRRYYVAVQAYDTLGQLSTPSAEASLVSPGQALALNASRQGGATTCVATSDEGTTGTRCDRVYQLSVRQPGEVGLVNLALANDGQVAASLLSLAATCTPFNAPGEAVHGSGNPCDRLSVYVQRWADRGFTVPAGCVYGGGSSTGSIMCEFDAASTLGAFAAAHGSAENGLALTPDGLGAGATTYVTVGLRLDPSAGNAYQGRGARTDLSWRLTQ